MADIYEVKNDIDLFTLILNLLDLTEDVQKRFDSVENVHTEDGDTQSNSTENIITESDVVKINEVIEEFLDANKSFKILWGLLKGKKFTAVIENNYVDRVYRDSYYIYYSKKHLDYKRNCKRILIFNKTFDETFFNISSEELQTKFKGSIVIRPLDTGAVGRSLLDPFYFNLEPEKAFIRKTEYRITAYGKQLTVKAFPYSMQDGETTTCAETTILNISDYYSQRYPDYRFILPSTISRISNNVRYQRPLPSQGLRFEVITKVFLETGFFPVSYFMKSKNAIKLKHIMHYYIESGIPVAIGLGINANQKHSIIGIGHGEFHVDKLGRTNDSIKNGEAGVLYISDTADIVDQYCVMDDNQVPYTMYPCKIEEPTTGKGEPVLKLNDKTIEYLMVPLSQRMLLVADDAYEICTKTLVNKDFGILAKIDEVTHKKIIDPTSEYIKNLGSEENPLCIRLFMASSKNFKKARQRQYMGTTSEMLDIYSETSFSRFIWVCELYTRATYPTHAIGELVLDATANKEGMANSIIMIHYPGICWVREVTDFSPYVFKEAWIHPIKHWEPFEPYKENLYSS